MKIKPIKNYKKPNYAKGLAVTLAAVSTLSGCKENVALAGDVQTIPDTRTNEAALDGNIAITEAPVLPEGTIVTEPEETEVVLDGDVAFTEETEETEPENTVTEAVTTDETTENTTTTTMLPPETEGTVAATEEEEDFSLAGDVAVFYETEETTPPPETENSDDIPEDEVFALDGDVAVVEDFTLEGDVVVPEDEDNSCTITDNTQVHIDSAYNKGLEYASDIKKYLDENDRPVNLHDDMSYLLETGDNGHFIVPIALEGSKYKMFVAFYDSENSDDPLVTMLENDSNASKVLYGYTTYDEFGMTYFYIDLKALRNNSTEEIASAICLEEVALI